MVIFHSYVSLPKGNQLFLCFNVCSFLGVMMMNQWSFALPNFPSETRQVPSAKQSGWKRGFSQIWCLLSRLRQDQNDHTNHSRPLNHSQRNKWWIHMNPHGLIIIMMITLIHMRSSDVLWCLVMSCFEFAQRTVSAWMTQSCNGWWTAWGSPS